MMPPGATTSERRHAHRCGGFELYSPPPPPADWLGVLFRKLPLIERLVVAVGFHPVGNGVIHRLVEIRRHLAVEGVELRRDRAFETGLPGPDHDRGAQLPGISQSLFGVTNRSTAWRTASAPETRSARISR